ncbi:hypothetical protein GCM10009655_09210 [Rhodoglobus aureus]|uniref:Uncharacterized protein n=1 Tax=Rhodoglobus aureus TaxID=191497 RepID=A0ABP4G483_9MICO
MPTPEPLIIPGCETLLPLTTAKSLFSPATEVLGDTDSVPIIGDELSEVETAISDASITKNCIWGIPNSDGFFSLTIADINDTDAANLKAALLSSGYLGATSGGATALELSAENKIGTIATTHYLVGDLWISVTGTSLDFTTDIADRALDEIRTANPTRSY